MRREEGILAAQRNLAEEIAREKAFVGQADVMATFTFSQYLARCDERRGLLSLVGGCRDVGAVHGASFATRAVLFERHAAACACWSTCR